MSAFITGFAIFLTVLRGLLVPVQFEDLKFTSGSGDFAALSGTASAYFNSQDLGIGELSFDVSRVYSSPLSYKRFGKNGTAVQDESFSILASAACGDIDREVDFSLYSLIVFLVPGMSEPDSGDEYLFWPRKGSFSADNVIVSVDGVRLDEYAIVSELGPDGNFTGYGDLCHEVCHLLGLPDFYDTDGEGSGGVSCGFGGENSLMDRGNHKDGGKNPPLLNALERSFLNSTLGENLSLGRNQLTLFETTGAFFKMDIADGRSFFFENREGKGLCISEADRSCRPAGYSSYQKRVLTAAQRWEFNEVNCCPGSECARFVAYPLDGTACVQIDSLVVSGELSEGGDVVFNVFEILPTCSILPLQTSAVFDCASGVKTDKVRLDITCGGKVVFSTSAEPDSDGHFKVVASGLQPRTSYMAEFILTALDGTSLSTSKIFRTRSTQEGMPPFILFQSQSRNEDGSFRRGTEFPLILLNPAESSSVEWRFNGREIDGTAFFKVEQDGILEAVINNADGSHTVVRKIIRVR